MRAVILCAGRGGRLRQITGDRPKCLASVGGRTLLERQLHALRACGLTQITVVTGYHASDVRQVCGRSVDFVHNARYGVTNSLYSLWLAREVLREGFVVLNCDVLFHPQVLGDLLTARYEDALLLAYRGRGEIYGDEEMKVRVRNGRVVEISKTMSDGDADGENIGIVKFGAAGAAVLVEEMDRLIASGAIKEWVPGAFAGFCWRRPLYVVDHRGFPWIEIDSPQDYWRACTLIAPALDDAVPAAVTVRRAADHV
jgi:choline kinase